MLRRPRLVPTFLLQIDIYLTILFLSGSIVAGTLKKIPFVGGFIASPFTFFLKFVKPLWIVALIITVVLLLFGIVRRFMAARRQKSMAAQMPLNVANPMMDPLNSAQNAANALNAAQNAANVLNQITRF